MKKIIIFTLISAAFSFSADYYAATDGNDTTGTGSEGNPWKTISYAATKVNSGDTVYIKDGNYNERAILTKAGTSAAKITFKAKNRRMATCEGFIINTSAGYNRIEGLQITNDLSGGSANGIDSSAPYVEIVDNYFYNVKKLALGSSGNNAYIADNKIYKIQMGIVVSGNDWVVEKNEIERVFWYGTMGDADYTRFFGENGTFRKNYFHGSTPAEIGVAHLDCWQTYDDNGEYTHNITIEGNKCSECHQGSMISAYKYKQSSHITFKNNIFNNCWAWGLCLYYISNVTAINNTFANIGYFGIGTTEEKSDCPNTIIKNNIFYKLGEKSYYFEGPSLGSIGDYNLIYNEGTPTAKGPHDIVGKDPLFVNAASNDFHLMTGSPCIDAGDPATTPPSCGGTRIDIGAYEYGCPDEPTETQIPITPNGGEERIVVYPNPANLSKTQSVKLANISLNYKINKNLMMFGRIENLFNEKYEETKGYQTAGFSIYSGFKLGF